MKHTPLIIAVALFLAATSAMAQTVTDATTAWVTRRCSDLISPSPLLVSARPRTFVPERETTRHRYQDGLPVAHLGRNRHQIIRDSD